MKAACGSSCTVYAEEPNNPAILLSEAAAAVTSRPACPASGGAVPNQPCLAEAVTAVPHVQWTHGAAASQTADNQCGLKPWALATRFCVALAGWTQPGPSDAVPSAAWRGTACDGSGRQQQQQQQQDNRERRQQKEEKREQRLSLPQTPPRWRRRHASCMPPPPSPAPLLLLLLLFSASMGFSPAVGQATSSNSTAGGSRTTSSGSVKWTFLIYMLADNNLECFGILDLIEMMAGMSTEPSGCTDTSCGSVCAEGFATTATTSCGGGKVMSRCCPAAAYPDVLVLADRGVSACAFSPPAGIDLDLSLLAATWTTAKELLVMPGGVMQQVRDLGEIDMAAPDQLAAFMHRAFARFPPTSTSSSSSAAVTRKYALVLWDHGNGWKGYGVDDTCSVTGGATAAGCDQFTMSSLVQGLQQGLAGQSVTKLDVLGFDACLMSMYEVAGALAPYARTMLASEMLEPGHGWDYGALGVMTAGSGSSSAAATAASAFASRSTAAEVALAEIWIAQYKAQAVSYQTTGITLALADLAAATTSLLPAVGVLADTLRSALAANSSYASGVLRRRTAMAAVGTGEQESSVDLGDLLTELRQSTELDAASRAAAVTAAAAYNATVLAFGRDDSMPRGTGLAIYFPAHSSRMDPDYLKLTASTSSSSTAAALAGVAGHWASFLTALYNASAVFAASTATFTFIQNSAASVPYIDVASGSYVLQGVLSSPIALSALSYYGFVDATENSYVLAGSQPALVDGVSVLGTWRRLLWGVTQTLNTSSPTAATTTTSTTTSTLLATQPPPPASSFPAASATATLSTSSYSASALMFAYETWQTSADGSTATSVSLSANVRYGDTCSAARAATSAAVLKYTYRFDSGRATLQLFAQQPSGAYGEVSAQAGGVIIPLMYKLPTDFSGPQSTTYQYSGCLKWGYNGTVRVVVVDMDSAADTLGVDVREDMLMFLVARDLSLTKSAYLVGSFSRGALADSTVGGCQCLTNWRSAQTTTTYSGCSNPDDDPGGPWCPIMPGSCTRPDKATGAISDPDMPWDFCAPTRTLAGCSCAGKYATDSSNRSFAYGKCYSGDTRAMTRGSWCTVDTTTCPSPYRAHGSNDTSYDYCEIQTVEGCSCVNSWTYNGVTYNGTCATGFYPESPPEGFTNSSRWCRVQPGCNTHHQLRGRRIGLCGPAVPPLAGPSNASCALPTAVSGGVVLHDCVPWRNGPSAADRADGIAPVCPLDANATSYGTCQARNCTALDMSGCPATSPQATSQVQTSGWLSRPCLQQLCTAALRADDNGTCAADGMRAAAASAQLSTSSAAAAVLRSNYSADSLEAYCTALRGADCLRSLLLPACPAIRLASAAMYDTAYVDERNVTGLCQTDCVKALCAVASTRCARGRLVESLRLRLLEAMDAKCSSSNSSSSLAGSAAGTSSAATTFSRLTTALMCPELMASAATCPRLTVLNATTGDIAMRPVSGTSQYAPLTNCTWRIQPPGMSYITLSFSSFSTEPLYDRLLVEDGDGVVAVVSGGADGLPGPLVTDTGLLVLTFTSDSAIQLSGFSATYTAATARSLPIPTCSTRQKLVQFNTRTRDYGNEISWVVGGFKITSNTTSSTISSSNNGGAQRYMLAAGGQLPANAYAVFPSSNHSAVATDLQYRNSRSYTTFGCLPTGLAMLYMFDGYGDGWTGGSLTVSYMPTSSTSYVMVNATVSGLNATVPLQVMATMPESAADYSAALSRNKGSGRFSVRFTLRLAGEVSGAAAVSDTKQLVLRGAVSAVLSVDVTTVAIQSVTAANTSASASGRRRSLAADADAGAAHTSAAAADDDDDAGAGVGKLETDAVKALPTAAAGGSADNGDLPAAAAAAVNLARGSPGGDEAQGQRQQQQQQQQPQRELAAVDTVAEAHEQSGSPDGAYVVHAAAAAAAATAVGGTGGGKRDCLLAQGAAAADAAAAVKAVTSAVEAPEEALVHGEGVVEALMARAQELGLRLLSPADEAGRAGGLPEAAAAEAEAEALQRRRRRGRALQADLTELLSDQPRAAAGLAELVSVQQPYFLWKQKEVAAGTSGGGSAMKLPTGDVDTDSGSSSSSSSSDASADVGSSSSESSSSSSEDGGSSSSALPPGYSVLANGLLVDPDGVPLISKGKSRVAAASSSSSTPPTPPTTTTINSPGGGGEVVTVDGGASAGGGSGDGAIPRTLVSVTHVEGLGGGHTVVRQAPALDAVAEVVAAMQRASAPPRAPPRRRSRSRNGGRTPVPALQQLLPDLLRQGAPHLTAVAAATASATATAGVSAPAGGAGAPADQPLAAGGGARGGGWAAARGPWWW